MIIIGVILFKKKFIRDRFVCLVFEFIFIDFIYMFFIGSNCKILYLGCIFFFNGI